MGFINGAQNPAADIGRDLAEALRKIGGDALHLVVDRRGVAAPAVLEEKVLFAPIGHEAPRDPAFRKGGERAVGERLNADNGERSGGRDLGRNDVGVHGGWIIPNRAGAVLREDR